MRSEIKLRLIVDSLEASPDEITEILGLKPSETALKGEKIYSNLPVVRKKNTWSYLSPLNANHDFKSHVKALFSILEPHLDSFSSLPKDVEVRLFCAVYTYNSDRPYLGFSAEDIKFLARIGASAEFDLYIL